MYIDYILLGIGFLITLIAQGFVSGSYAKYKKVKTKGELTGFEVARKILDENGLTNVYVTETKGNLTDHYDPSRKVVRLSTDIFHGTSIASLSVAAHEVGHALQDKEGYTFLKIRSAIVPVVNFASSAGWLALMIGIIAQATNLIWIGIGLEIVILLFQLITLPVEFNASDRAKKQLKKHSLVTTKELEGSDKMLKAAAFTYVAAVITSILEIVRLIIIFGGGDDR